RSRPRITSTSTRTARRSACPDEKWCQTPFFMKFVSDTFFVSLAAAAMLALAPHPAFGDSESAGGALRLGPPAAAVAVPIRQDDVEGRRQFYRSFAANVGATLLLKAAVDDERPDGTDDDAFPSGHASMAFQAAGFLHRRYGARKAWPAYVLAGFVGWSRLDADEHEEADVIAGAALGVASAFLLAERRERAGVAVSAGPTDGGFAVRIAGRF